MQQIVQVFRLPFVAFLDPAEDRMFSLGHANVGDLETTLREVAKGGGITRSADLQFTMTAIQLGGRPLGSLGVVQGSLSDAAMQAIAQLAAIAIERAREQKAASRVEAARQSEQLKSRCLTLLLMNSRHRLHQSKPRVRRRWREVYWMPSTRIW